MTPKEELSPEERLLRLIRHPGEKNSKKTNIQATSDIEKKASKPAKLSADLKAPKAKEIKIVFGSIKSINFTLINRLILLAIFVVLALFLFELYLNQPQIQRPLDFKRQQQGTVSLIKRELRPFSYYEDEISKRSLFKAGPTEPKTKKVIPAGLTFKELIKDLQLLGIVSGDNPQVIIEDRKLQKTYFLYPGDYLGEIKVEEIHSDKVILEFNGERISLFL